MKLNIANPSTGTQKIIEVDDERKLAPFLDKKIAQEVDGDLLGDQFKGYVFKITGGYDKTGVPMKQGVLIPGRVRLLMREGTSCYRPRRNGERKRKTVRGCITSNELSIINLVIVKKGEDEIPGITDKNIPRRLGPKRASKIRKLFNLTKEYDQRLKKAVFKDDVRKYVVRREIPPKEGKEKSRKKSKAPKIQRLVTPLTLQRKRRRESIKKKSLAKSKADKAEYIKLLAQRSKDKRHSIISKKRQSQVSEKKEGATPATTHKPAETPKPKPPTAKAEPKKHHEAKKHEAKKHAEHKKPEAKAHAEPKSPAAKGVGKK